MSAITAKASRKMKKYAVLTREPRCFLGSFDFSWEQRKLSHFLEVSSEKNTDNLYTKDDVLSVSGDFGVVNQIEFQGRSFAGASVSNYGVVHTGDVVYTKSPLKANPYGIIKANKGKNGIVSVLYGVYHTRENANADFIQMYFEQDARLNNYLRPLVNKGAKNTLLISDTDALEGEVCLAPTFDEQKAIGQFFDFLDNLITLHQRKCALLFSPFQALISMMFTTSTFSWEQRKLGDISEIKTGPFGSTLHADDYVSDGTPIITTEHFKTGALPRSKNGLPQVSDSDYKRLTAYTLDDGDIVFSRVGSVDINALITPFQSNWLFSGRVLRVRPQTDISSKFLHTRLETESIKTDIRTRAVGQTMPSINTEILKITPLVLPSSAAEQEQIGSYFAALDNLITLHQRKCISFTGRAGRLISTVNKKRITSSWEQRKAIDIADYSKGNGYSKGDLTDAGTQIILYGRLYTKYQFAISEVDTFAFPRNGAVYSQGNEVIVPASGETAEDIARASAVEKSGVLLGGDLNILRPFDFINPLFLALAISNGEPQKELAKKAQGKSVVHIHNTDIQEVTIAYPSRTEQDRIVSVFRQLDNLITLHQRKPFLMKWRNSDANRNQTNRLVL